MFKKEYIFSLSLICIVLFSIPFQLFSQDTLSEKNVSYGFSKSLNSYSYFTKAYYNFTIDNFSNEIKQNYFSNIIQSSTLSKRDDQDLRINSKYKISDFLSILNRSNFLLTSNSYSSALNNTSKLNSNFGINYAFDNVNNFSIYSGLESNKQSNINSVAYILGLENTIKDIKIDEFNLYSDLTFEQINLSLNRYHSDYKTNIRIQQFENEKSYLIFDLNYKGQKRDFITSNKLQLDSKVNYESRFEDKYGLELLLSVPLGESSIVKLNASGVNSEISRKYNYANVSDNLTFLSKSLNETIFNVTSEYSIFEKKYTNQFFINYSSRIEENNISKEHDFSSFDISTYKISEALKNNSSQRIRLSDRIIYNLNSKINVKLEQIFGILNYDTPGSENYDDRDEFLSNTKFSINSKISNYTQLNIDLEYYLYHLVYLKAQKSFLNNWNRILKFSPNIIINFENFTANPRFEVLANYTIYDFENYAFSAKSFSYRQISYMDSIKIKTTYSNYLQFEIKAKYFERSILFWNDFKEKPQNSNSEIFSRIMYYMTNDKFNIGFGLRYFTSKQNTLVNQNIDLDFYQISFGPDLDFIFSSKSIEFRLVSWFEHQEINNNFSKNLINIYLNSKIKF